MTGQIVPDVAGPLKATDPRVMELLTELRAKGSRRAAFEHLRRIAFDVPESFGTASSAKLTELITDENTGEPAMALVLALGAHASTFLGEAASRAASRTDWPAGCTHGCQIVSGAVAVGQFQVTPELVTRVLDGLPKLPRVPLGELAFGRFPASAHVRLYDALVSAAPAVVLTACRTALASSDPAEQLRAADGLERWVWVSPNSVEHARAVAGDLLTAMRPVREFWPSDSATPHSGFVDALGECLRADPVAVGTLILEALSGWNPDNFEVLVWALSRLEDDDVDAQSLTVAGLDFLIDTSVLPEVRQAAAQGLFGTTETQRGRLLPFFARGLDAFRQIRDEALAAEISPGARTAFGPILEHLLKALLEVVKLAPDNCENAIAHMLSADGPIQDRALGVRLLGSVATIRPGQREQFFSEVRVELASQSPASRENALEACRDFATAMPNDVPNDVIERIIERFLDEDEPYSWNLACAILWSVRLSIDCAEGALARIERVTEERAGLFPFLAVEGPTRDLLVRLAGQDHRIALRVVEAVVAISNVSGGLGRMLAALELLEVGTRDHDLQSVVARGALSVIGKFEPGIVVDSPWFADAFLHSLAGFDAEVLRHNSVGLAASVTVFGRDACPAIVNMLASIGEYTAAAHVLNQSSELEHGGLSERESVGPYLLALSCLLRAEVALAASDVPEAVSLLAAAARYASESLSVAKRLGTLSSELYRREWTPEALTVVIERLNAWIQLRRQVLELPSASGGLSDRLAALRGAIAALDVGAYPKEEAIGELLRDTIDALTKAQLWADAIRDASASAPLFLTAVVACAASALRACEATPVPLEFAVHYDALCSLGENASARRGAAELIRAAAALPMPVPCDRFLRAAGEYWWVVRPSDSEVEPAPSRRTVRRTALLEVQIDRQDVSQPRMLRAGCVYELMVRIEVHRAPRPGRVTIRHGSALDRNLYRFPELTTDIVDGQTTYTMTGSLVFHLPQSPSSPEIEFVLQGLIDHHDGTTTELVCLGRTRFRVRVRDERWYATNVALSMSESLTGDCREGRWGDREPTPQLARVVLSDAERREFEDAGMQSQVPIRLTGRRTTKLVSLVEVDGEAIAVGRVPLRRLLILIAGLYSHVDGWLPTGENFRVKGLKDDTLFGADDVANALSRVRGPFHRKVRHYLTGELLPGEDFIQHGDAKARIATHRRFISWDEQGLRDLGLPDVTRALERLIDARTNWQRRQPGAPPA